MTKDLRATIPNTWHSFFGRFGSLTAPQQAAIGPVAAGRSVLLAAPTASGKTEALLAPMIDRLMRPEHKRAGLRVVIASPTRALCNDLRRRILRPIEACNWQVDIKTGDSPGLSTDQPPEVLVTTPESLDSLLSRHPAVLATVGAMFLDEVHLLDGGPRGDHLCALVARLRSICDPLQVCAASATAADGPRLAKTFAGPGAELIEAGGGGRKLRVQLREAADPKAALAAILALQAEAPGDKLLVFANTRAEVEWLSTTLRKKSDAAERVFAHHGSLSRDERLRVERQFLGAPSGVCVATMTLELGVDIGDVDRAVLVNPPPNVASFGQRVGRSNRRSEVIEATCLWSTPFDRQRFEQMIACTERGELFSERVAFRPTIIAQQAVSLLFQNPKGWVSAGALHSRLPDEAKRLWGEADCEAVLKKMRRAGYLHADARGRYVADEPARRDHRYGRVHAHIAGDAEVEVVDEATGRTIGTASWERAEAGRDEAGGGLALGGRNRKVTRVRDERVFVEADDLEHAPQFLSRMGPRYSFALARDLARFVGAPDDAIVFLPDAGDRAWRVEHFLGTIWGQLLAARLRDMGFKVEGVGPFFLTAKLRSPTLPDSFGAADAIDQTTRDWLHDGYERLARRLQAGPWRRHTPDELVRRWVTECVRPDAFADVLAGVGVVEG